MLPVDLNQLASSSSPEATPLGTATSVGKSDIPDGEFAQLLLKSNQNLRKLKSRLDASPDGMNEVAKEGSDASIEQILKGGNKPAINTPSIADKKTLFGSSSNLGAATQTGPKGKELKGAALQTGAIKDSKQSKISKLVAAKSDPAASAKVRTSMAAGILVDHPVTESKGVRAVHSEDHGEARLDIKSKSKDARKSDLFTAKEISVGAQHKDVAKNAKAPTIDVAAKSVDIKRNGLSKLRRPVQEIPAGTITPVAVPGPKVAIQSNTSVKDAKQLTQSKLRVLKKNAPQDYSSLRQSKPVLAASTKELIPTDKENQVSELNVRGQGEGDLGNIAPEQMAQTVPVGAVVVEATPKVDISVKAGSTEVIDLSNVSSDQVMEEIGTHLRLQSHRANPTLQLNFFHKDLGQFNVELIKTQAETVEINIQSQDQEVIKAFRQGQDQISNSISESGIRVSAFRIESSGETAKSGNETQNSSHQQKFTEHQHRDQHQDSKRRQELWQAYKERS